MVNPSTAGSWTLVVGLLSLDGATLVVGLLSLDGATLVVGLLSLDGVGDDDTSPKDTLIDVKSLAVITKLSVDSTVLSKITFERTERVP